MAFTFDLNRDLAVDDGTIIETSRAIEASVARTQLGYYVEANPEVPFDINNVQNGDTNALAISSTAVYNQLAGFCFPSQQYIPKSDDTSLTAGGVRVVSIGRPTLEDRIKPGSITASVITAGATSTDAFMYNDLPSTSNLSSLAPIGEIRGTLTTSLSASIVGTVFYDYGLIMFHGHDQIHDFDYTAKVENGTCSGFHLNSLSSQNSINFSAQLVTEKFVKRGQYFCHVYNKEANFSTNPTFANVSGNVYSNLTGNPTTFITSVGLLNNAGEVLAVAKVAPVVKKDFNSETVFKINLDY
tara:strand:+ start:104 stop:1000 length:897 start_codon:yes stop_codon:yes gene_type:complete